MNPDAEDGATQPLPPGVKFVLFVAGLLVLATVGLTFTQVVLRTVFNNPQAWAEEVSRYLFAWIVFLGSAVAFARGTHIRIDFIDTLVGPRLLSWLGKLRLLTVLGAAGIMIYAGGLVAWRNRSSTFYTLPWFPQVLFYVVIPISGALTILFVLWPLVRRRIQRSRTNSTLG